MMIVFPSIEVKVNHFEDIVTGYSLYINGIYEGTYPTKTDLEFRIGLICMTELNRGLSDDV